MVGNGRRDVGQRHQAGAGVGATDGHKAFAADVLLAEDGEIVLLDAGQWGLAGTDQPGGQGVAAGPCSYAGACAVAVEAQRGGHAARGGRAVFFVIADTCEQAMAGKAADIGAAAAVAQQAERIAGGQAERGIERITPKMPARAGLLLAGRFQVEEGLDLAAAFVPYRQDGAFTDLGCRLRVHAAGCRKGNQESERKAQKMSHTRVQTQRQVLSSR